MLPVFLAYEHCSECINIIYIYIYILCTHIMYILFTKCYKLQILHILLFTNNNLYYIINSHIFYGECVSDIP